MTKLILDKSKKYLLAVSGGVDSMYLLHLLSEQGYCFELAHVNYNLREESQQDFELISEYAKNNNLKLHYINIQQKPFGNIQNWARKIRYNYFSEIIKTRKIDILLTGHHQNDQIENIFLTLLDNKNTSGLIGIRSESKINGVTINRPLINLKKKEIYQFALKSDLKYNEDKSNQKNQYKRNYIRNLLGETVDAFPNQEESTIAFMQYHNYLLQQMPLIKSINHQSDLVNSIRLYCFQNQITFKAKYVNIAKDLLESNKSTNYIKEDQIHFVYEDKTIRMFTSEFNDSSIVENYQTLITNPNAYIKLSTGRKMIRRFYIDNKVNRYYRDNIKFKTNSDNQIIEIPYLNFKEKK
jgi:tRNA(Ile)-lysidine synthase